MRPTKTAILAALLLGQTATAALATTLYGDQFKEFYPEITEKPPVFPANSPFEKDVVVKTNSMERKATLVRTDGTKALPAGQFGVITIESSKGRKIYLTARNFRGLTIKWINDRLLYIYIDIGHIAGADAIFDAETNKWIYRQSMSYATE